MLPSKNHSIDEDHDEEEQDRLPISPSDFNASTSSVCSSVVGC